MSQIELRRNYEQEVRENLSVIKEESAKSAGEQVKKVVESLQKEKASQSNTNEVKIETKPKNIPETQKLSRINEKYVKISEDISVKTKNKEIVQNTKHIDTLYESARTASKELEIMKQRFAKETGGEAGVRPK